MWQKKEKERIKKERKWKGIVLTGPYTDRCTVSYWQSYICVMWYFQWNALCKYMPMQSCAWLHIDEKKTFTLFFFVLYSCLINTWLMQWREKWRTLKVEAVVYDRSTAYVWFGWPLNGHLVGGILDAKRVTERETEGTWKKRWRSLDTKIHTGCSFSFSGPGQEPKSG